jgi:tellurite methyltransferase
VRLSTNPLAHGEDYWDKKYEESPYGGGKDPSKFLLDNIDRLQKGKVLDVGMGEGANAVYLAQKGFKVRGFDYSQKAIDHANALAKDTGVEIETKKADLDLFLFGLLEYDSVIMMFYKPPIIRYYSEIIRALKQGGTLLVESWTDDELPNIIGQDESYRDFYFKSNELLRNLKGMRILFYNESIVGKRHVIQCLAQKPADRDAAKYALFDMQSTDKKAGPTKHQQLAEELFKKKK